jgi:hypothetical protein
MLVGIGVAAALGSYTCTQMCTKMAKQMELQTKRLLKP